MYFFNIFSRHCPKSLDVLKKNAPQDNQSSYLWEDAKTSNLQACVILLLARVIKQGNYYFNKYITKIANKA